MTDHERVVAMLVETFQPARWTSGSMAGYVLALGDISADVLHVAALDLMRTSRFMPRPAELRAAVLAMVTGPPPDPGDAWAEVMAAVAGVGRGGVPAWTHPLIGRAVDAVGGWVALCNSSAATADRAQFIRAMERLTERTEHEALATTGLAPAVAAALPDVSITRELPEGDDR